MVIPMKEEKDNKGGKKREKGKETGEKEQKRG